jgi:hypothetical protein
MSGFFDLDALIEARLREAVTAVPADQFFFPASLEGILGKSNAPISLHVCYLDYAPSGFDGWDSTAPLKHRYAVVVGVQNKDQQKPGPALRATAAPILGQVIDALRDWQPEEGDFRPGHLAPAPEIKHEPGFAYYPLAFYFAQHF